MKKPIILLFCIIIAPLCVTAQITIEQCVEKAMENYPEIRKYDLVSMTREIDLSDIDKGWLPRISAYGQTTVQNAVPSFPESLSGVLQQMGQSMKGLDKLQYKVGVDISQTIWDGGMSRARRDVSRLTSETQRKNIDVELYAVRQRVENLYFAILLTEEQIAQTGNALALVNANLEKLQSMLRNGTAMQCDVDMVAAQALTMEQDITRARSAVRGYRQVLEIFIGESLADRTLVMPDALMPSDMRPARPELSLFENRIAAAHASRRLSDVSLMPKVGFFAQTWYGYPGFDYFKSMMNRNLSFNIMAGVKVTWNIDAFYTKKNTGRRTAVDTGNVMAEKETFLFNTGIQSVSQQEKISGLRSVMADDAKIMELRTNVRKAAESQLENGVIDATALLTKITDENQAKLTARFHEIQLIQEIYNLKYILNR